MGDGRWVARKKGRIVAEDESLLSLMAQLPPLGRSVSGAIVRFESRLTKEGESDDS